MSSQVHRMACWVTTHRLARLLITIAVIACTAPVASQPALAPQQATGLLVVNDLVDAGQARISGTKCDIGSYANLFDGDEKSICRSANINPQQIVVELAEATTLHGFRVWARDNHRWKIEVASSLDDLDRKAGSYAEVVKWMPAYDGKFAAVGLRTPVRAKVMRLTVQRMTGDDFVHTYEWEIFNGPVLSPLEIDTMSAVGTEGYLLENQRRGWRTFLLNDNQQRQDFTSKTRWSSSRESVARVDEKGVISALAPGQTIITASAEGFEAKQSLIVVADPLDLNVTFIERLPRYDYNAPKNTPATGDAVTFVGHLRSWGKPSTGVAYRWIVDGKITAAGTLNDLGVNEDRKVELPWVWQTGRHTVGLQVDPDNKIEEVSEFNNRIVDRTDGLAVGFWVEQTLFEDFHARQRYLGVGSNSWEDWAQRQMGFWNAACVNAVWPNSPQGVIDRVRVDKIVVVPDGSLPLMGGLASNNPTRDLTIDLMWGYASTLLKDAPRSYNSYGVEDSNFFFREGSLVHELGHARYLVDYYKLDVADAVKVTENGTPVYGTTLLPFVHGKNVYYNQYGGIMAGPYGEMTWSPAEAGAHNRIAGKRASKGNQNSPGNIGEYLQDIPKHTRLRFAFADGTPLAGAEVHTYQAERDVFEDKPVHTWQCDADGIVSFDGSPFPARGRQELLLRIAYQNQIYYRFFEIHEFNLAFWRGDKDNADIPVEIFPHDLPPSLQITGFGRVIPDRREASSPADHTDFGTVQHIEVGPNALPDYATRLLPHITRTFVLQNRGGGKLKTKVSLSGRHASDFILRHTESELSPGNIAGCSIMFLPKAVGPREATVTLSSNDPERPVFRFKIQGIGVALGDR